MLILTLAQASLRVTEPRYVDDVLVFRGTLRKAPPDTSSKDDEDFGQTILFTNEPSVLQVVTTHALHFPTSQAHIMHFRQPARTQ